MAGFNGPLSLHYLLVPLELLLHEISFWNSIYIVCNSRRWLMSSQLEMTVESVKYLELLLHEISSKNSNYMICNSRRCCFVIQLWLAYRKWQLTQSNAVLRDVFFCCMLISHHGVVNVIEGLKRFKLINPTMRWDHNTELNHIVLRPMPYATKWCQGWIIDQIIHLWFYLQPSMHLTQSRLRLNDITG